LGRVPPLIPIRGYGAGAGQRPGHPGRLVRRDRVRIRKLGRRRWRRVLGTDTANRLPERRRGVARLLVDRVAGWAAAHACSVVLVTVTPQGERSHTLTDFYERLGFS